MKRERISCLSTISSLRTRDRYHLAQIPNDSTGNYNYYYVIFSCHLTCIDVCRVILCGYSLLATAPLAVWISTHGNHYDKSTLQWCHFPSLDFSCYKGAPMLPVDKTYINVWIIFGHFFLTFPVEGPTSKSQQVFQAVRLTMDRKCVHYEHGGMPPPSASMCPCVQTETTIYYIL